MYDDYYDDDGNHENCKYLGFDVPYFPSTTQHPRLRKGRMMMMIMVVIMIMRKKKKKLKEAWQSFNNDVCEGTKMLPFPGLCPLLLIFFLLNHNCLQHSLFSLCFNSLFSLFSVISKFTTFLLNFLLTYFINFKP